MTEPHPYRPEHGPPFLQPYPSPYPPAWQVPAGQVRWGIVALVGTVVTAATSITVAATFLLIIFTYGLGLLALPITAAAIVMFVVLGAFTLKSAQVTRPHLAAWLVSLTAMPVATVISTIVPLNLFGRLTETQVPFWITWIVGMVVFSTLIGASTWCLAVKLVEPRRPT